MSVNLYNTTDYENKSNWTLGENKPNSNPIKANFRKAQMNVNSLITKDYRKNDVFADQKTNPIQTQSKPVLSAVEWANFRKNESKLLYCRVKLFLLLLPP